MNTNHEFVTSNPTQFIVGQKFSRSPIPYSVRIGAFMILLGVLVWGSGLTSSASLSKKRSLRRPHAAAPPTARLANSASREAAHPISSSFETAGYVLPLPVPPSAEMVATYASDCTTPKTEFAVGDTICVQVSGISVIPFFPRHLILGNANSTIIHTTDVVSDPQTDSFVIDATSIIGGNTIDNRGSWRAIVLNPFFFFPEAAATFTVTDPQNATADVGVATTLTPGGVQAGTQAIFELQVKNYGPNNSANVQLTDTVPAGTTFVSFQQTSGPTFTCSNPDAGTTGTTTCSITSLDWPGPAATFIAIYQVNGGAATNTAIVNTANVSTTTDDQNTLNSSTTGIGTVIEAPAGQSCSFDCPANITATATSPSGAIVNFASAINLSGDCGAISASPGSGSLFPVGTTVVNVSSDAGPSCSFTVTVSNTPAPTITCPSDKTVTADQSGTYTFPAGGVGTPTTTPTMGVTVTFLRSDNVPATFDANGNVLTPAVIYLLTDPFPTGTTGITWTVTDSIGRTASCEQKIVVTAPCATDTQTPTITAPPAVTVGTGSNSTTCGVALSPSDGSLGEPTVVDDCSATVTISGIPPGNLFPVGATTLTYTATDRAGHAASDTQLVTVTDNTPPVIFAPADASYTCPSEVPAASASQAFGPAGPNTPVFDNCGSPTVAVADTSTGTGSAASPLVITRTYTATDIHSNSAIAVQIITVTDPTPPTITLNQPGQNPQYVECHTSYPELGATAHDNCSADFAATPSGSVNVNVVGTYTITYNANDTAGNAATPVTRTVIVQDTTKPVITLTGANPQYVECHTSYVELGAKANDTCAGIFDATPSGSVNANVIGTYTITYNATDPSSNAAVPVDRTVIVRDTIPPTISCPANIIADFNPAVNGAVVTYTTPVGMDDCGATTSQTTGLPSGATFPLGTTTNTFVVTDGAGLTATCSFKVTVALTSIVGLNSVSITGNALVDSYDSTVGYPASKGSLANVLSNGTITVAGSSKVFGNVRSTQAGVVVSGTSQVTGNATAGTTVSKGASAIIGGTITNNALVAAMTLPSVPVCGPPYSSNSGITGTYTYNASTGDLSLSGINIATLANGNYCFHNVTLTHSGQLKVNGPVVINLTGTLTTSGATSLPNTTLIPSNLQILSSYSGSNGVNLGNSSSLQLVVYAPQTGVSITGSAPLFGTVAGKTVTVSNSGMIHYDTKLKIIWPDIWTLIFGP